MAGTRLLLVAALDARLLQQLAVLLLGHALAALLDDRAHRTTLLGLADDGHANTLARSGRLDTYPRRGYPRCGVLARPDAVTRPSGWPPRAPGPLPVAAVSSRGTDEGSFQVLIDCLLGDPEGTSDADRFQLARVDQAIHGHL